MRRLHLTFLLILGFIVSAPLTAQPVPVACEPPFSEFPISEPRSVTLHSAPSVAYGNDGHFVVVYQLTDFSSQKGAATTTIHGRRFDAAGNFQGPAFPIHDAPSVRPSLERDAEGHFLITWTSNGDAMGRRLSPTGAFSSPPFVIQSSREGTHGPPDLATDEDGALFVWQRQLDGHLDVLGRRSNIDGDWQGPDRVLHSDTSGDQAQPTVTSDGDGGFLVVWQGPDSGPQDQAIFGRRVNGSGVPQGEDFLISTQTGVHQQPDIAHGNDGFLVVWSHQETPSDDPNIKARQLDAVGLPVGGEILLQDRDTYYELETPSVAARRDGQFVVAWNVFYEYPYSGIETVRTYVEARTVDPDGTLGPVFPVSTLNDEIQCVGCELSPDVATSPLDDEFAAVWGEFYPFGTIVHGDDSIAGARFDAAQGPGLEELGASLRENADPNDGSELLYWLSVANNTPCQISDVTLEATLSDALLEAGFSLESTSAFYTCQVNGATITCQGNAIPGQIVVARVRIDPSVDASQLLRVTSTVTSLGVDPDLSNNTAVETTNDDSCGPLSLTHTGKGQSPVVSATAALADCPAGEVPLAFPSPLTATPAADGWKVRSWSGTDDDTRTSRFNTVTLMDDAGTAVHVDYTFDGGRAWWSADGNLDDSIGSNNLTQVGAGEVFDPDGVDGQAFQLDGDPVLTAPVSADLPLTDPFTLGFWVQVEADTAPIRSIMDRRLDSSPGEKGLFVHLNEGRPTLRLADGTTTMDFIAGQDLEDGLFHQVVMSLKNDRLKIFIDGALDSEHDTSAVESFALFQPLTLGSTSFGDPQPLDGLLDEIFIASGELSLDRVRAMYTRSIGQWRADGNALDSSSLARHGSLSATTGYTQGRCDRGFDLALPEATVQFPNSEGASLQSDAWTLAAWVRAAPTAGRQRLFEIFGAQGEPLRLTLEDGELQLRLNDQVFMADALGDLRDGLFHHLVLTGRPSGEGLADMALWVDDASQTFETDQIFELTASPLTLGGVEAGPEVMDEIVLLDYPLTAAELARLRQVACPLLLFIDGFEAGNTSAWSQAVP